MRESFVRASLIMIVPVLAIWGCSAPETRGTPQAESTATAQAQAQGSTASAQSRSSVAKAVARSDDLAEFKLSYPEAVGAIPSLASLVEDRAREAEAEMREAAREDRIAVEDSGGTFRPHHLSFEWEVVADIPRLLSLSNSFATYTGGAHGMYGVQSLVWDRREGRALDGAELFVSPAALRQALGERFCRALDRERRERRGGDGRVGGAFDECPPLTDLTILVGSANNRTFDRLTLYAGPYVAGPYAEGAYEIDLPVDAAVLAAVRPEYRDQFSIGL